MNKTEATEIIRKLSCECREHKDCVECPFLGKEVNNKYLCFFYHIIKNETLPPQYWDDEFAHYPFN